METRDVIWLKCMYYQKKEAPNVWHELVICITKTENSKLNFDLRVMVNSGECFGRDLDEMEAGIAWI